MESDGRKVVCALTEDDPAGFVSKCEEIANVQSSDRKNEGVDVIGLFVTIL